MLYFFNTIFRSPNIRIVVLFLLCLVVLPNVSYAVEVNALVDRTHLALGESLQLSVSIKGADGEVNVSAIRDFKVISRGAGSSVQMVNGRMSREVRHNYTLLPLKEGLLRIPELAVNVGGHTLGTKPIEIRVTKDTGSVSDRRAVYVEAEVSEPRPYLGQQISYRFRLLNAVPVSNARYQAPEFDGFIAREIEERKSFRKVISGREYAVVELVYVLTPLTTGEMTIGVSILECSVAREGRRNRRRTSGFDDFFRSPFSGSRNFQPGMFRTPPVKIEVKPLPEYQDADAFSGLVGVFDFQAELDPQKTAAGESVTLTLTIQGIGNIMDAQAPDMPVPENIKVYRDEPEEDILLNPEGYQGRKVFRTALVPVKPGSYTWQPLYFVYFDTTRQQYVKQIKTLPQLFVDPAGREEMHSVAADHPLSANLKQPVQFKDRDMLPIKDSLNALESEKPFSVPVFFMLLCAPFCFYLILIGFFRYTREDDHPAAVMSKRSRRALKEAAGQGLSNPVFLSLLHRALVAAIFSRADLMGESMTYVEAENLLRETGCPSEDSHAAAELLASIDTCNYGGSNMTTEKRRELLENVQTVVRRINK